MTIPGGESPPQARPAASPSAATTTTSPKTELSPGTVLSFIGGLLWFGIGLVGSGDLCYKVTIGVFSMFGGQGHVGAPAPGYGARARIFSLIFGGILLLASTPKIWRFWSRQQPAGPTPDAGTGLLTCVRCGTQYPSQFYFRDEGRSGLVCTECAAREVTSPPGA